MNNAVVRKREGGVGIVYGATKFTTTNDIFFATSFQTKRKVMWPIFFRLSFREDMKEWKTENREKATGENHPPLGDKKPSAFSDSASTSHLSKTD